MGTEGYLKLGDELFPLEGVEARRLYLDYLEVSHYHFLSTWYERLTGVPFDADDFPWRNPFYLDTSKVAFVCGLSYVKGTKQYVYHGDADPHHVLYL